MITHTLGLALETLASLPAILAGRVVANRPQQDTVDRLRERYAGLTNVDAGSAILRALDATPETGGES